MTADFFTDLQAKKTLPIRVIPHAKKTEIVEKMEDGMWKIRVQAPALDGKANTALLKFFKKNGGVVVQILHGKKSHQKVITLSSPTDFSRT